MAPLAAPGSVLNSFLRRQLGGAWPYHGPARSGPARPSRVAEKGRLRRRTLLDPAHRDCHSHRAAARAGPGGRAAGHNYGAGHCRGDPQGRGPVCAPEFVAVTYPSHNSDIAAATLPVTWTRMVAWIPLAAPGAGSLPASVSLAVLSGTGSE